MAVYLVKDSGGTERLVDAANKASARNHVARDTITVEVAKQRDLFRVAQAGGDIETAGEEVTVDLQGDGEDGDDASAGTDELPPADETGDNPPKKK